MSSARPAVVAALLTLAGCRWHDPAKELAVSSIETYWIVDSPQQGENYISPAVRFRLTNVGPSSLGTLQARARFPGPGQEEPWGSIQEQVSTLEKPLLAGKDRVVTVRSVGRYHAPADPEDMLRSPGFQDPRVEIFLRIGASNWAKLAETQVERRIGAPGVRAFDAP